MGRSLPTSVMFRLSFFLLALAGVSQAIKMSFEGQKATVKVGSVSKKASCDISVSYYGSQVLANGNSVSCTIPWPKNKALNKAVTMFVVVGDVHSTLATITVSKHTLCRAQIS